MRRQLTFLFTLMLFVLPFSVQAQDDEGICTDFLNEATILLTQAQNAIAAGDLNSAQAYASGARALIALCKPAETEASSPDGLTLLSFDQGYGAQKGFWQVYFTAPTGSRDSTTYVGGVDTKVKEGIDNVQSTLDIAAFEWNNPILTQAVIDAHNRGVQVRMVVDNEHALEDEDSTIQQVIDAGVSVIDDDRSGLMHNKFMIMDSQTVWMGSMNYTINGTYRNNNNMLVMTAPEAVTAYQAEFNEMFEAKEFASSRSAVSGISFREANSGDPVQILFSPEDGPVPALEDALNNAQSSIRFMTFSFTLDEIGALLLAKANAGVDVSGIFETRGSRTSYSELPLLYCAGLNVYEDGNPYTFHHKVFIIDEETVVTGSFNISDSATENNDENMVIITDRDLAAQYLAEFERMEAIAERPSPSDFKCP